MTGHAPMLPKWAYGFFQSKGSLRFARRDSRDRATLSTGAYPARRHGADWFWWKTEGDPIFNSNYHDVGARSRCPAQRERTRHDLCLGPARSGIRNVQILDAKHELVAGAHVYDATNPEARDIYWGHLPGKLLAQGWDAFWLDSAEPEEYWPHMGRCHPQQPPSSPSATAPNSPTSSRSYTPLACRITGEPRTRVSASFCSRAQRSWAAARRRHRLVGRRLRHLLGA